MEEEREAAWLRALEAGDTTVLDLIAITGLGRSQIYGRLKRARENRGEVEDVVPGEGAQIETDGLDRFDYPYMELSDMPARDRPWCMPEGYTSEERGTFHVGGQVRSLRGGVQTTDDDSRTDGKPQPTRYQPDPDGLKGGL